MSFLVRSRALPCPRLLFAALVLVTPSASPAQTLQPQGWDADVRLKEAVDRNPDPNIVEIDLQARIADVDVGGRRIRAWTYDGGLPGPLIRAKVGDRLIVHFSNTLPAPTTVHWHGVRVPIEMDGVPGYSQPEVEPGRSFTYDYVLRDAGLYWYHPHVMSAAQVGFGLYGAILVDDPSERVGVEDELVLVLSDIGIEDNGALESPESGGSAGMAFGREGNHVLINGRHRSTLRMRSGAPQRWRIVNAAKSRHFQLDFLGDATFLKIGDDAGLQEYPAQTDVLLLAAGQRADVIVTTTSAPGSQLTLQTVPYNRGYGSIEYRTSEDLLSVDVQGPAHSKPPPPRVTRSIEQLSTAGATRLDVTLTMEQRPDGSFAYGIEGVPFGKGRELRARLGETQIWTVINKTKWSHPFHLHGFFFQVLDKDEKPVRPLAWKDTVNVPFDETVRLVVRFDERPGYWMYHCHILDHADGGLMSFVVVGDPKPPVLPHTHP